MSVVDPREPKTDRTDEKTGTTGDIKGKVTSHTIHAHKLIELFGSDGVSMPASLKRIGHAEMTGSAGRPSIVKAVGMDGDMAETVKLVAGTGIGVERGTVTERTGIARRFEMGGIVSTVDES
jgi:hypothetical protein